jgi:hypothetical protein
MKRTWLTMWILLAPSGCGDDGSGDELGDTSTSDDTSTTDATSDDTSTTDATSSTDDASDTSSEGPSETSGEPALSFAADVYPIIMTNCGCHLGNAPGQLAMPDADTAYANLVGVASIQVDQDRVVPGDTPSSYLFAKITGTQPIGDPMPPVGPLLGADDLMTIATWIAGGALP